MDELIIDDKKYISSKQAAKITGYAKDYVGQLCREGRVPARLVGRSWYVLESAIKDHRFGADMPAREDVAPEEEVLSPESVITSAWQAIRYEATTDEPLPRVERPKRTEEEEAVDVGESFTDSVLSSPEPTLIQDIRVVPVEESDITERVTEEHVEPTADPEDVLEAAQPKETVEEVAEGVVRVRRRGGRQLLLHASIRAFSVVVGVVAVALAVLNSGYFDTYVYSDSRVHFISGINMFIK